MFRLPPNWPLFKLDAFNVTALDVLPTPPSFNMTLSIVTPLPEVDSVIESAVRLSTLSLVWSKVINEIQLSLSSFLIFKILFAVSYHNWFA